VSASIAVTLTAGVPNAVAQVHLTVVPPAKRIPPGLRADVVARTQGLGACRLEFPGAFSSTATLGGLARVHWSWRVPRRAATASWTGQVTCWRNARLVGVAPPDAIGPQMTVRVAGASTGVHRLATGSGVQMALEGAAPAAAKPGDQPKWTDIATAIIAFFGLAVTALGLIFVWRQLRNATDVLRVTRDQARYAAQQLELTRKQAEGATEQLTLTREQALADRTAVLMERYHRYDFMEVWSRVGVGFMQVGNDVVECSRRMRTWDRAPHGLSPLIVGPRAQRPPATPSEVQYAVNVHEEIGVLFNSEKIDPDQVIRHFGSAFVNAFDRSWWWVHWRRRNRIMAATAGAPQDNESEIYAEWQRMACTIVSRRPDAAPRREPDAPTWIVCLPASDARHADVVRHERLSASLTRRWPELDALHGRLDAEFGTWAAGPFEPVRRVICLPRWEDRVHQLELQDLAKRLAAALADDDGLARLERVAGV
jgi:hypothetical protein